LKRDPVVADKGEQLVVVLGCKENTAGEVVAYILHMAVAGNGHVAASGKKKKQLLCCHCCLNLRLGTK
jgi:hypothetical protein